MPSIELFTQAKQFLDDATLKAKEYSSLIGTAQQFILDTFGQNGLYAAYIVSAALILYVGAKIATMTYSALKYLVIPSLVLAFAGSFFVPYSFVSLLPVTVSACSLFLLFKG